MASTANLVVQATARLSAKRRRLPYAIIAARSGATSGRLRTGRAGRAFEKEEQDQSKGNDMSEVILERRGRVAIVTLNRPESLNAFTSALRARSSRTPWSKSRRRVGTATDAVEGRGYIEPAPARRRRSRRCPGSRKSSEASPAEPSAEAGAGEPGKACFPETGPWHKLELGMAARESHPSGRGSPPAAPSRWCRRAGRPP